MASEKPVTNMSNLYPLVGALVFIVIFKVLDEISIIFAIIPVSVIAFILFAGKYWVTDSRRLQISWTTFIICAVISGITFINSINMSINSGNEDAGFAIFALPLISSIIGIVGFGFAVLISAQKNKLHIVVLSIAAVAALYLTYKFLLKG